MRAKLARLMIKRAERWYLSSRDALAGRRYDDSVYCSQMCAEQSGKAVLALFGVEYPKAHDISDALKAIEVKAPRWFGKKLDEMCAIVSDLAERKGLAGYGFEKGLDVSYFANIAPKALKQAKFMLKNCKELIESHPPSPPSTSINRQQTSPQL